MKKALTLLVVVAVFTGTRMMAFSQHKRPIDMNRTEKIQQNLNEVKKETIKKEHAKIDKETQDQSAEETEKTN